MGWYLYLDGKLIWSGTDQAEALRREAAARRRHPAATIWLRHSEP